MRYEPNRQAIADSSAMRHIGQRVDQDVERFERTVEQKNREEVERLKRIAEQAYLTEDLRIQTEKAHQEAERERERVRREAERAQQEAERKRRRVRREAERAQQEAERKRRRKLLDFWMSLSGQAFERELAAMYRQFGYQVESTPISGDGGVDLILRKPGKKTVVQCKAHKAPIGPEIARALYGSMYDFSADSAILACTGGFTSGVRDFVKGKPIELISASELVMMADRREDKGIGEKLYKVPGWRTAIGIREEQRNIQGFLRCPKCQGEMRLASDIWGKLWRCKGYPQCVGIRR